MKGEVISEDKLENIVGGEFYTPCTAMALMSVFLLLVAAYKVYMSSKGRATFGNDYSFEWS